MATAHIDQQVSALLADPRFSKLIDDSVLKGVEKGLSPVQEALKILAPDAKNKGTSPAALMAALSGPSHASYLGHDGAFHQFNRRQPLNNKYMVGYREKRNPMTGHLEMGGSFNEYLAALAKFTAPPNMRTEKEYDEAKEKLTYFGVTKMRQGANDRIEKVALNESSGIAGGYTVPTMFAEVLMTLAVEATTFAQYATHMQMTSKQLLVPSLDITTTNGAGVSNFLGGLQAFWTAEGAARQEYEPQFRQTQLTAWVLGLLAIASMEILQDNAVGLEQFLTQYFALTIGWFTEYAFFQGNGVGKPLGILNAPACLAVTKESASKFTYQDARNMFGSLWTMLQGENSVAWWMHPSCLTQLLNMNDESGGSQLGRMLFVPINQGAQADLDRSKGPTMVGYLFGKPVFQTEKLPALNSTGCVLLADASKYLIGDRMETEIDVSWHYKFANWQLTWRVNHRCDGQPWLQNVITLADGVKTTSPFVQWSAT